MECGDWFSTGGKRRVSVYGEGGVVREEKKKRGEAGKRIKRQDGCESRWMEEMNCQQGKEE